MRGLEDFRDLELLGLGVGKRERERCDANDGETAGFEAGLHQTDLPWSEQRALGKDPTAQVENTATRLELKLAPIALSMDTARGLRAFTIAEIEGSIRMKKE